jgi:hypothetical protein
VIVGNVVLDLLEDVMLHSIEDTPASDVSARLTVAPYATTCSPTRDAASTVKSADAIDGADRRDARG